MRESARMRKTRPEKSRLFVKCLKGQACRAVICLALFGCLKTAGLFSAAPAQWLVEQLSYSVDIRELPENLKHHIIIGIERIKKVNIGKY